MYGTERQRLGQEVLEQYRVEMDRSGTECRLDFLGACCPGQVIAPLWS